MLKPLDQLELDFAPAAQDDPELSEPPIRILLTAREVGEILRVPRSTVYELTRSRRIPFLKVGRRTLFEAESLWEWIRTQTFAPR